MVTEYSDQDFIQIIHRILSSQYFAVLNTVRCGKPFSNLVAFAAADDMKSIVFSTSRKNRIYTAIKRNSVVSLLIDNRTNQPEDISNALAITVMGTACENAENRIRFRELLINKVPPLERFVSQPGTVLIEVMVDAYIVSGFNQSQRVSMGPS